MHLRYIRLDKIRETFSQRYSHWRITLPERLAPSGDIDDDEFFSGWSIHYALGHDEGCAPCLFVAADHRMTSPSFYLIRETGEILELDSYGPGIFYDPEIEGDHEKQEQDFLLRNQLITSLQRLCGVAGTILYDYYPVSENVKSRNGPEFINRGKFFAARAEEMGERERDGETFFADDSPFSLRHPCAFSALGLRFHSAAQHVEWLGAAYAGLLDKAEAVYAAPADDPILAALWTRRKAAPADISARRLEIWRLYEASRYKFLQNDDLREALCATRGRLVYASAGDDCWGRTAGRAYEREEKGKCLGAALSLLRADLRNEREYYAAFSRPGRSFFSRKKF
ncbi:MAG: NADAR family protein [Candidatus Adiutrix sp.]|jgi:predicted NAD-dependent protein-ADP-ribosyltransferase YbiA (DUF1768 family)|nr:NADAR family protein [Candidatus Adiutrix sp.]